MWRSSQRNDRNAYAPRIVGFSATTSGRPSTFWRHLERCDTYQHKSDLEEVVIRLDELGPLSWQVRRYWIDEPDWWDLHACIPVAEKKAAPIKCAGWYLDLEMIGSDQRMHQARELASLWACRETAVDRHGRGRLEVGVSQSHPQRHRPGCPPSSPQSCLLQTVLREQRQGPRTWGLSPVRKQVRPTGHIRRAPALCRASRYAGSAKKRKAGASQFHPQRKGAL